MLEPSREFFIARRPAAQGEPDALAGRQIAGGQTKWRKQAESPRAISNLHTARQ